MKKVFLFVLILFFFLNFSEIIAFSSGVTGYYNSTLGSSCMTCHGGVAGGFTQLDLQIPQTGIVPNGIYAGSIKGKKLGAQIFGFSLVAQTAPFSDYGELIPFDTITTQNIVGNLTHQKNGGLQNDSIEFKFFWKAPAVLTSNAVTFKWNLLCGNNDGNTTGDVVANGSQWVNLSPNSTQENTFSTQIFPNPFEHQLNIRDAISKKGVQIFNESGQLIYSQPQGTQNFEINCSNWKTGVYFVKDGEHSTKVLKK